MEKNQPTGRTLVPPPLADKAPESVPPSTTHLDPPKGKERNSMHKPMQPATFWLSGTY